MTNAPLVTVICLCYNHENYVEEALLSVVNQAYTNIQIMVVDDASTDNSVARIIPIANAHKIEFIRLENNLGNCKAFNTALAKAKGEYIIDFATDDVMMPDRVEQQVKFFSTLEKDFGVVFTDAEYVDEKGSFLRNHYAYLFHKGLIKKIPQGDVYVDVLQTYFISSPTMMVRQNVFQELKGYDENLSYEDFDFWVRTSRNYKYAYLDRRLTKVRRINGSLSTRLYGKGDRQLHSTYLVCLKAKALNKNQEEDRALAKRVKYELRHAAITGNTTEAKLFFELLIELNYADWKDQLFLTLANTKLPFHLLRALYHHLKYT